MCPDFGAGAERDCSIDEQHRGLRSVGEVSIAAHNGHTSGLIINFCETIAGHSAFQRSFHVSRNPFPSSSTALEILCNNGRFDAGHGRCNWWCGRGNRHRRRGESVLGHQWLSQFSNSINALSPRSGSSSNRSSVTARFAIRSDRKVRKSCFNSHQADTIQPSGKLQTTSG